MDPQVDYDPGGPKVAQGSGKIIVKDKNILRLEVSVGNGRLPAVQIS